MAAADDRYRLLAVSAAAAAATAAAALAATSMISVASTAKKAPPATREIIPSPRTTLLPRLTAAQRARRLLAYPPDDALPGGRDVDTPFGSMRVYEWGPEAAGRKVLLVHGNATPSPVYGAIAEVLVAKGCRVMTFDLWGRGYTDTPADMQHDSHLFTLQIHYAIASSPIAWTGERSGRFSLVGYSLGGPIVLDFFSHFPGMVESLVLLAPVGLLRALPKEYTRIWFDYPSLVSKAAMRRLIGAALGVNTAKGDVDLDDVKDDGPKQSFSPGAACQFQFDHHRGHIHSFLSTLQYGPAQHQEAIWEKAGDIISGVTAVSPPGVRWPLHGGKILVVCGASDDVVPPDHVREDLTQYMGGPAHFDFKTVPGDHGFIWTEGEQIGTFIADCWGL